MLDQTTSESTQEPAREQFRLFSRGRVQFAIPQSEIVAIGEWRRPAPLPNAPDSVLGVVGIEGRMLTVLDLGKISDVELKNVEEPTAGSQILALRGDEQLALVADDLGEMIELPSEVIEDAKNGLLTTIKHDGVDMKILNPRQLFSSAIQGRERRRRRF